MKNRIVFNLISHSACTLCKGTNANILCFTGNSSKCIAKQGLKN